LKVFNVDYLHSIVVSVYHGIARTRTLFAANKLEAVLRDGLKSAERRSKVLAIARRRNEQVAE